MENTNECDFNNNKAGKKQSPYYDLEKHFIGDGYDDDIEIMYQFQGCF